MFKPRCTKPGRNIHNTKGSKMLVEELRVSSPKPEMRSLQMTSCKFDLFNGLSSFRDKLSVGCIVVFISLTKPVSSVEMLIFE